MAIEQIVDDDKYPFTLGQMRNFLINREDNGLKHACRKIGKRIYIRDDLFDLWIEKFK